MGFLRVIAGQYKGCRLKAPTWEGLRPTSDKLRETLFNILASRIEGSRVLDGFAGTGALGIEALSRGAAHVTFVDRDRRAMALLTTNLDRCGIKQGYAMMRGGVETVASGEVSLQFDLILLDPPYDQADTAELLARVGRRLARGGLLVLEHARRRPAPEAAGPLVQTRVVASGDSALAFYEVPENVEVRESERPTVRKSD
jgi:16S rRNA (guanine966-N2)-methyltransferase